jgi:hypothetical protein
MARYLRDFLLLVVVYGFELKRKIPGAFFLPGRRRQRLALTTITATEATGCIHIGSVRGRATWPNSPNRMPLNRRRHRLLISATLRAKSSADGWDVPCEADCDVAQRPARRAMRSVAIRVMRSVRATTSSAILCRSAAHASRTRFVGAASHLGERLRRARQRPGSRYSCPDRRPGCAHGRRRRTAATRPFRGALRHPMVHLEAGGPDAVVDVEPAVAEGPRASSRAWT